MAASGRDICATSGMLDWNPSFWKLGMDGLAIFADGVEEVRKAVRQNIHEGADVIKLYVTGEGLLTLRDTKGRLVLIPAAKLAYVEVGGGVTGQVGFRS